MKDTPSCRDIKIKIRVAEFNNFESHRQRQIKHIPFFFCPGHISCKNPLKFLDPEDEPHHHQNVSDCSFGHFPPLPKMSSKHSWSPPLTEVQHAILLCSTDIFKDCVPEDVHLCFGCLMYFRPHKRH